MKLLLQLTLLFLLYNSSSANNMSFEERIHLVQKSGSKCVLDIATKFFTSNNICIVTVASNNITNIRVAMPTHELIFNLLMKEQRWSMFSKTTSTIKNYGDVNRHISIDNYIFFVKSQSDLNSIMDVVTNSSSWSPHANLLMYIERFDDDWKDLVGHFFKTVWKYWMLNVSILVPDKITYGHNVSWYFLVD